MNLNDRVDIVIFSSRSFVELRVGDDIYELHEISIHECLNMPGIASTGTVGFSRIAKSKEYEIAYQPIEPNKKYVASVKTDPRGLLYSPFDDSSPIMEATPENVGKFTQYVSLYDSLSLGITNT
ncbi:hypothetical protein [Vibrio nitrifigilis]|uniref:Uncharacterized protein n=1 Tax=Vibrio nitrifigilis TaxID=2789781 RepID=A0ABS0GJV7_9VIBR|nr:hypothetical protein [Vibrio nitrifigilis]MBF9002707.1 hypothetical protein [Vibrio nitrifigilis]